MIEFYGILWLESTYILNINGTKICQLVEINYNREKGIAEVKTTQENKTETEYGYINCWRSIIIQKEEL